MKTNYQIDDYDQYDLMIVVGRHRLDESLEWCELAAMVHTESTFEPSLENLLDTAYARRSFGPFTSRIDAWKAMMVILRKETKEVMK